MKTRFTSVLLLSAVLCFAGFNSAPAAPGNHPGIEFSEDFDEKSLNKSFVDDRRLLRILLDNGVITREQYDDLLRELEADRGADLLDDDDDYGYTQTDMRARRFRVRSEDGLDLFRLRGRLYVDGAYLMLDNNKDTVDDDRAGRGDLADYGTIIRNARIGAKGVMYEDWLWRLELDFRDLEIRFRGSYVEYNGFNPLRIMVGNLKAPIGLEWMTSRNRNTFLERAASLDAYKPDWSLGARLEYRGSQWNVMGAVLAGDGVERNREINEGYGFAGRASVAPYVSGTTFTHVGLGGYYRVNSYRHQSERDGFLKEYNDVRLRTRIGTRAVDGRFIGREDIEDVMDYHVLNAEAAFGVGSFSVQGEVTNVTVRRDFGPPNLSLGGWYAQASYFLTGESRAYRPQRGNFGAVIPNRDFRPGFGPGALELAVRYSTVDSIDEDYDGGKMDHFTVGLNWYFNREFRMMFNYIYLDAERANGKQTTGSAFAVRMAFEF